MYINQDNEIMYYNGTRYFRIHDTNFLQLALAGETRPNPDYIQTHTLSKDLWNYYNFEYIVSGRGYIETPTKSFTVEQGDLYFLSKMREHKYYSDPEQPFHKYFICVSGTFVDGILNLHGLTQDVVVVKKNVGKYFKNFFSSLEAVSGNVSSLHYI
ncbi:MAG: AraC family ligand binding domain-containing protein [Clostridia bacterium]|nr:AraC family ligand binding domain-containing protein [Clostridia bacterium]